MKLWSGNYVIGPQLLEFANQTSNKKTQNSLKNRSKVKICEGSHSVLLFLVQLFYLFVCVLGASIVYEVLNIKQLCFNEFSDRNSSAKCSCVIRHQNYIYSTRFVVFINYSHNV